MARTAPAPNVPPTPGMCPFTAVKGGGGGGGGSGGKGAGAGGGGAGAGAGEDGDGGAGGGKNGGCAEGDPICPITGRVFATIFDFGYGGPMAFRWERHYDSRRSDRAGELGHGWTHNFGWRLDVRRNKVHAVDQRARLQVFDAVPRDGEYVAHPIGLKLSKMGGRFRLYEPNDDLTFVFGPDLGGGRHLVEEARDGNNNRITFDRDERGVLRGIVDSAGRPYRVSTDEAGRLLSVAVATEPTHQQWLTVVSYTYDEAGNLASATDAAGYGASYTYDGHLLIEHRSVSGLSYCYRYDGRTADAYCIETWGEYIGQIDPALEVPIPPRPDRPDTRRVKGIHYRRFFYVKEDRYCEVENGLGGITRYWGDELGRGTKIVDPHGGVTERWFDPDHGGLVQEQDAHDHIRTVVSDPLGGAAGALDAEGRGRRRRYLDDGVVIEHDERTGTETHRRFDERGNLRFIRHADGTTEEWEVDERGLWTRRIQRDGSVILYQHDAMGNMVRATYPAGRVEENSYDYLGRRTSHVDANGRRTEWQWDVRSEIVEKRHHDGSVITVTYDANRKPVRIVDAGKVIQNSYGGMAWKVRVERPDGRVTERRYDTEGNLTLMRNARGQEFRIVRDQAGSAVEWTTFEGVRQTAAYNPAGEKTRLSGPTGDALVSYDPSGEVSAIEMPDGGKVSFERPDPQRMLVDNGVVALETLRDVLGRVVFDKQGDHTIDVEWEGGKVATVTPSSGPSVSYRYGSDGMLSEIAAAGTKVGRTITGVDELRRLGDKLLLRERYGPTGHLELQVLARIDPSLPIEEQATEGGANVVHWARYEHDLRQNLCRESRSDGSVVEYDVSPNWQVTERRLYRGPELEQEEKIAYDAAGTPLMAGARYDARARPTALGGEKFAYDTSSRLVRRSTPDGDWSYRWNDLDQLVEVVAPRHRVEMSYDAFGRRARKRVIDERGVRSDTSYIWSNNTILCEKNELDGSTRTYLRANDEWDPEGHVEVRDGERTACFYIKRPNGAVDCAVDESGKIVWAASSTIYGEHRVRVSDVDVSLRQCNHYDDPDVGLTYNRRRWYEPRLGLYITPDPLLLGGTQNPRDYVDNPHRMVNPLGLKPASKKPTPVLPDDKLDSKYLRQPGHFVGDGKKIDEDTDEPIPAFGECPESHLGKSTGFPASTQAMVDKAGAAYGCHSCGSKESHYTNPNHWTCDHQPPKGTYSDKTAKAADDDSAKEMASPSTVKLYPHCKNCSSKQGGHMSAISRGDAEGKQEAIQDAKAVMKNHDPPPKPKKKKAKSK